MRYCSFRQGNSRTKITIIARGHRCSLLIDESAAGKKDRACGNTYSARTKAITANTAKIAILRRYLKRKFMAVLLG